MNKKDKSKDNFPAWAHEELLASEEGELANRIDAYQTYVEIGFKKEQADSMAGINLYKTKSNVMDLKEEFEKLEGWLKKQTWPPMTYMLIPNILQRADELILHFENQKLSKKDEVLLEDLKKLRTNFKRTK